MHGTVNRADAERARLRGDRIEGPWIFVKKSKATLPADGAVVMVGRWWLELGDELMYYKSYSSPQCNADQRIAERVALNNLYDGLAVHVEFEPIVFTPRTH